MAIESSQSVDPIVYRQMAEGFWLFSQVTAAGKSFCIQLAPKSGKIV